MADTTATNNNTVILADWFNDANRKTYGFTSVAHMLTTEGLFDGQTVPLLGYYAVGDGGQGEIYWDATSTETADDGMIFQVTGVTTGRWKRPDKSYLGMIPEQFGTKGDGDGAGGGTDDTAALQSTINAASNFHTYVRLSNRVYNYTTLYLYYDSVNNTGFSQVLSDQIVKIVGTGMIDEQALAVDNYITSTLYSTQTTGDCIIHNKSSLSVSDREADATYFSELNIIGNTSGYLLSGNVFKTHARAERVCFHNKNSLGGGVHFTGYAFDFAFVECLIMGQENFWAVDPNIRAKEGVKIDAESSQNLFEHCYIRGWNIGLHTIGGSNLKLDRTVFIANNIGAKLEVSFFTKSVNLDSCHAELNTYYNYLVLPTNVDSSTGGCINVTNTNGSTVVGEWTASIAYAVNKVIWNGTNFYRCVTAGTSAGSGGPTGTGTGIIDNTVVWDYISAVDTSLDFVNLMLDVNSFTKYMKASRIQGGYFSMDSSTTAIGFKDNGLLAPNITDNRFIANTGQTGCLVCDATGSTTGQAIFARNVMDGSGSFTTITYEDGFAYIEDDTGLKYIPSSKIVGTTITADSDAVDVKNLKVVPVGTGSGNIIIGGLANGVAGQTIDMYKAQSANTLTIEHNEVTGTQKILTADGLDITLTTYGGVTMTCDGTSWFVVSQ